MPKAEKMENNELCVKVYDAEKKKYIVQDSEGCFPILITSGMSEQHDTAKVLLLIKESLMKD